MSEKIIKLNIQGSDIRVITNNENDENDYICLTDLANKFGSVDIISNWMRTRSTIEFLGLWEGLNNQNFNSLEFDGIKNESGSNKFTMSVKKWHQKTNAMGIFAKTGKYNSGTYAHKDIAMEFASWVSQEFKLYLIKEFQRLKKEEAERKNELVEWNNQRWLTKLNYKIQTDAIQQNIIPLSNLTKNKEYIVYSSEADLLNIAVFGMKACEFEKQNPDLIKQGRNIRDCASKKALNVINNLQSSNAKMIREGIQKEKRAEELIIQASEEKKSLNLISKMDLFQNDLFNKLPLIKEEANLKSDKFIQNIQQDKLELEENNKFDSNLSKIAKYNKK